MTRSRQEIFDIVAAHLLKQGEQSFFREYDRDDQEDVVTGCAYRSKDGKKCALGALMADEDYRDVFEHQTLDKGLAPDRECSSTYCVSKQIQEACKIADEDISFALELQGLHDHFSYAQWSTRLMDFAETWALKPDVLL